MAGILGDSEKKQTTTPYGGQYLDPAMKQAQQEYLGGMNPYLQQYQQMLAGRGQSGAGFEQAGRQQLEDTLGGKYLYGGEGFNKAVEAAQRQVMPQVQSAFAKQGAFGGSLNQEALTSAMTDAFARQYGQERQLQMGALGQVPGMQGVDYANIGALGQAGGLRGQRLREYIGAIGGIPGGTVTQTGGETPLLGRMLAGGAGGFLAGKFAPAAAGLTGPMGAGLGLLMGAFGK